MIQFTLVTWWTKLCEVGSESTNRRGRFDHRLKSVTDRVEQPSIASGPDHVLNHHRLEGLKQRSWAAL